MSAFGLFESHFSGVIYVGRPVLQGLVDGVAEIGTTLTLSYQGQPASGAIIWYRDGVAIPGATTASLIVPANDAAMLSASVDGQTSGSAVIRHPRPSLIDSLPDQSLDQNTGPALLNSAVAFSFAGTPFYGLTGAPAGVTVNPGTGQITLNTDELAVQSLTSITVRLSDAGDASRFAETSFALSIEDVSAPSLSALSVAADGTTGFTGSVQTNEAGGTLYVLVSSNASESAAAVKAGSGQTVSAAGAQNLSGGGLMPDTSYRAHVLHRDSAGNDSLVLSSAPFSTGAAVSAPAAFAPSAWSVNDMASGGDARLTISAFPDDGGAALSALQYRIASGAWQTLAGTSTGNYDLLDAFTDGQPTNVSLRAVNAVGAGPASAAKSVTTSAPPQGWALSDNGDGTFSITSAPAEPAGVTVTDNGDGSFNVAA